jgi:hypothetical protein
VRSDGSASRLAVGWGPTLLGVSQSLNEIVAVEVGVVGKDLIETMASRDHATIILTVTRIPRMQGVPPMISGSWVMRSNCSIC